MTTKQTLKHLSMIVVLNDKICKTVPLKVQPTTVRAFVSGKGLPLWCKQAST